MSSASTSLDSDLESQRGRLQLYQPGVGETRETTNRLDAGPSRPLADPALPLDSEPHAIDVPVVNHGTNVHHPEREDNTRQIPTQLGHGEVQPDADTHARHVVDPNSRPVPNDSSAEPRMIGDFDDNTNKLWSLYGEEAESHDKVRIKYLKEDMDGVLIFAGIFSGALTSFVLDSKQNLQVNPTDQMVYYLQQHSTILSQISQQVASIAPQVSIPSSPPPPFPSFTPSTSDIRINAFWFMALAFSLSAALLAILVQQCLRDYMHVFQRYSDPQKSSRMRQYLSEGSDGWYMSEAVPGLLHVSLFLFFAGLADATLNINTTIGLSTTIPIGICGLLYIFITLAPVIYPRSPYQTLFSGAIWYAVQKFRGRRFKDRDGSAKSVSTNMAQGQMQLSMEGTMDREGRDKRAILWLMDNLTEDNEIETFVTSMPGSLGIWTKVSNKELESTSEYSPRSRTIRDVFDSITVDAIREAGVDLLRRTIDHTDWSIYRINILTCHYYQRICSFIRRQSTPSPSSTNSLVPRPPSRRPLVATSDHEYDTIRMFCWRIGRFFGTCTNRAAFGSDVMWRMRYRACLEVMASLVSFSDVEADWFQHTSEALGEIGSFEGARKLSLSGEDEAFVVHWTCLSIIAVRPTLNDKVYTRCNQAGRYHYRPHCLNLSMFDEMLEEKWGSGLTRDLSSTISFAANMLEEMELFDDTIRSNIFKFDEVYQRITYELPYFDFDFPDSEPSLQQILDLLHNPAKLRFMACRQPLQFFEFLERVDARDSSPNSEYEWNQVIEKLFWPKHFLQRIEWSIDDIHHGGLGFLVELFLLSLRQLLSTYPSQESNSALYIGTYRAITSDRRRYTSSPGTLNLLLNVVASKQGFLRTFNYPDYITDGIWKLLGDILEVHHNPQIRDYIIDDAVQQLTDVQREVGYKYAAKAEALIAHISRLRA